MSQSQNTTTLRKLAYSAICVALSVVLSKISLFEMPQGGTVTACSMLFISLVGYWYGVRAGITAGLAHGLLHLFFGAHIVHPAQYVLDYLLAFGALGLSGFFRGKSKGLYYGYIVGLAGKFLFAFISGVIFFAEYAPIGQHVWIYSALYQLSYIIPEMIITLIVISLPPVRKAIERLAPITP